MSCLLCLDEATKRSSRTGPLRSAVPKFGKGGRHPKHCRGACHTIFETKQNTKIGLADAHRVREHCLEYRVELAT